MTLAWVVVVASGPGPAARAEGTGAGAGLASPRELLRDVGFQDGFEVLAPQGGGVVVGRLGASAGGGSPAWQVAQWNSRFAFTNHAGSPTGITVSNTARWLLLDRAPGSPPALTLGVDTRPEYDGRLRRSGSEPWVHLLVQQAIPDAPSLAGADRLRLRFETRQRVAETFRPEGYTPGLHAAQFQVVLTLNNTRRGSPGFGDYLWFVLPVYDDRHAVPPAYVAQDFAMTQGKLIYNPGVAALAGSLTRDGDWTRFDGDLLPWLDRALAMAWEKGYLRDSRDRSDYRLAHINVGWEVPGMNRVAMELRGLSLTATPGVDRSAR